MKADEILRQVRVNVLRDVDADEFQFNDKELLDGLNHTIQRMLKLRPILKWTDTHTYQNESAFRVATAQSDVQIPDDYLEALIQGTCEQVCNSLQADQAMMAAKQKYAEQFMALMRL